jgi:hypothetical protein
VHETAEEEVIYPVVRSAEPGGDDHVARLCVTLDTHKFRFGVSKIGKLGGTTTTGQQHKIIVANSVDLDRGVASRRADTNGQRRTFTEAKAGFQDVGVHAAIAALVAILIAVYVGDADLDASDGWRYASWVAAAYIVSRGLAKLGTREPYAERFDKHFSDGATRGLDAMVDSTSPDIAARPSGACQTAPTPAGPHGDRTLSLRSGGSDPRFDLTRGRRSPALYAKPTSLAKEVSDMNRLAERLGYLWQRYVAWRDPRPFNR